MDGCFVPMVVDLCGSVAIGEVFGPQIFMVLEIFGSVARHGCEHYMPIGVSDVGLRNNFFVDSIVFKSFVDVFSGKGILKGSCQVFVFLASDQD